MSQKTLVIILANEFYGFLLVAYLRLLVGKRKVLWHNMREEPLLYLNGKPYVVRDADRPFANLEYTGDDADRFTAGHIHQSSLSAEFLVLCYGSFNYFIIGLGSFDA